MKLLRCTAAFTLLDMLLAIFVSGLLLSWATLSLKEISDGNALRQEARRLYHDAVALSLEAKQRGVETGLRLHVNGYTKLNSHGETHHSLEGDVVIDRPQKAAELFFRPNGVSSPYSIHLKDGKNSCDIIISLRGRIRTTCKI